MPSRSSDALDWQDVDYVTACKIDARHRVAWATEVVAKVAGMYSPHFREKYMQRVALELARRFYLGHQVSEEERRCVIHDIENLVEEAEAEGYSRNLLAPGVDLLLEMGCADGKGCANAVDYASLAFAANIYYRQGVRGTGMPIEYGDSIANFLYAYAWKMFTLTAMYREKPTTLIPYASVPFVASVPALPREILTRSRRLPPAAETEYLTNTWKNHKHWESVVLEE
jgi:hypothetical protein